MLELVILLAIIALQSVALLVAVLIAVSFLIYFDRKVWAAVMMRRGPNVVGPWGLLQSFADLLKFVFKEVIIPDGANKGVYIIAPMVTAILALAAWAVIPLNRGWAIAQHQCGRAVPVRAVFAWRLWRDHRGDGPPTPNIPSWRRCVPPRRWYPMKSRSAL